MADALRHLDVCAGIGGFSLGLKLALGDGVRTVGYVEREAFAASVLLARMEDETLERAPVWCGPLEDLDGGELRGHVDILTAGFPCQPYSAAGKREGDSDERAIWPRIKELAAAVQPNVLFLENVRVAAFRQPFDDIQDMGFALLDAAALTASDLGAGHHRRRVFVLAHRRGVQLREQPWRRSGEGRQGPPQPLGAAWWAGEPGVARVVRGVPGRVDRHRAIGNSVCPQMVAAAWEELTR